VPSSTTDASFVLTSSLSASTLSSSRARSSRLTPTSSRHALRHAGSVAASTSSTPSMTKIYRSWITAMACSCSSSGSPTLPLANGCTCLPSRCRHASRWACARASASYDPMVSPHHFEVFCVPLVPENIFYRSSDNLDPDSNSSVDQESLEWPLSSRCTTHVFSSRKWRWEERSFVRQQGVEPANETIADLQFHPQQFQRRALYLKGEIYVQCKNNSLMR
jgi:hypothetical protein